MRIVLFTDVSVFRRSLSRNGLLVMFDPAKSHESVETVVDDLASS